MSPRNLATVAAEAAGCRACPLWKRGTQTVFGAGSPLAEIVFVGEQPGHEEDLAGVPFVGPAGRLLDDGLAGVGIDRTRVYVTNVVKHFKWIPRGKRRIHQKPNNSEIEACRPWLQLELEIIEPRILVPLGATAAQALLGRTFRVTKRRGEVLTGTGLAPVVIATVHPSAVLRAPDDETRRAERQRFFQDLEVIARVLREPGQTSRQETPPTP